ncbi:MAG: IS4 family transposase [Methylophilaceae bacterium]
MSSREFIHKHRDRETDFTRESRLTFAVLVSFCMNMVKGALQSELNRFFQAKDGHSTMRQIITASAFSKARKKLSELVFVDLNKCVNDVFYQNVKIQKWHGYRILAVDGSRYQLPNTDEVHALYGGSENQHERRVPIALGSCLYDVFQGLVIDAQLGAYHCSERALAYEHLFHTQSDDLILYDRGYPAFWFFVAHEQMDRKYCIRASESHSPAVKQFVRSGKSHCTIMIRPDAEKKRACRSRGLPVAPVKVRLVRVKVTGKQYILMTNLHDKKLYTVSDFKQLYHFRWQIEESYKKQKSWLEIENFSGKSVLSVKQDFHARVLSQTLSAITAFEARSYMSARISSRQLGYKINFVQTLSAMKDTIVRLIFGQISPQDIRHWLQSISRSLSAIRPGRSFSRKPARHMTRKFHYSYKRAL